VLLLCAALGACGSTAASIPPAAARGVPAAPGAMPVVFTGSAWDKFRHRSLVLWACRDIASGDLVSNGFCHALPQVDRQWPGMEVPPSYRGMPTG